MNKLFRIIATQVSVFAGRSIIFFLAVIVVVVWLMTGPFFDFSDTWQLVINTGTTIVTFLMVFLIQNTQNRDSKAVQLKLDEIIRTTKARDEFMDLEDLTDEELQELDEEFRKLHDKAIVDSPALKKLHKKIQIRNQNKNTLRDIRDKFKS
ncbi:MAG: low affinity iron permease family protein [Patescibacteria group bacterium]